MGLLMDIKEEIFHKFHVKTTQCAKFCSYKQHTHFTEVAWVIALYNYQYRIPYYTDGNS